MKDKRRSWRLVYDALSKLMEDAFDEDNKELLKALGRIDDILEEVDPTR